MSSSTGVGKILLPESWEKALEPADLPKPELNPLHNPILARHMGRWAQVYFTTPPEKRDSAVLDLIRELQRDEGIKNPQPLEVQQIRQIPTMNDDVICAACGASNRSTQKFCGICGQMLAQALERMKQSSEREEVPLAAPAATVGSTRPAEPAAPPYAPPPSEPTDTEWIRERTLVRFNEVEEQPKSGWGKYAVIGVVVLLAAFGALEWLSRKPVQVEQVVTPAPGSTNSAVPSQPGQSSPAAPAPAPPQTAAEPPAPKSETVAKSVEPPKTSETRESAEPREPRQAADRKLVSRAPSLPPANTAASGDEELTVAQHFLRGSGGSPDNAEAAKYLWKAVGKGNTTATLLLADLYIHGNGVSKNCDQARLLLVAAAKKGDTAAGDKLRQFESSGCQ